MKKYMVMGLIVALFCVSRTCAKGNDALDVHDPDKIPVADAPVLETPAVMNDMSAVTMPSVESVPVPAMDIAPALDMNVSPGVDVTPLNLDIDISQPAINMDINAALNANDEEEQDPDVEEGDSQAPSSETTAGDSVDGSETVQDEILDDAEGDGSEKPKAPTDDSGSKKKIESLPKQDWQ
ncbi:MAG: hypothetical protein ABIH89_04450 [Elusimicrobiota bacterium]